jgi:hypothetical protein
MPYRGEGPPNEVADLLVDMAPEDNDQVTQKNLAHAPHGAIL